MAIRLAKKFGGELVSADSRTIYRGLDIGTAKSRDFPHHLIDIVPPWKALTLAEWKRRAIRAIRDILRRGKVPILVGGTGLYVSALIENWKVPKVPPDPQLRARLTRRSIASLLRELQKRDPASAAAIDPVRGRPPDTVGTATTVLGPVRSSPPAGPYGRASAGATSNGMGRSASNGIDPKNKRRLIRALEVCIKTGKPFSALREKGEPLFDALLVGIRIPRQKLYARIDARVDAQMRAGWLKETEAVLQKLRRRLPEREIWKLPGMSGLGYRELGAHLRGKTTLPEAVAFIKRDTRRYAKRQLTWWRREKRIHWVRTGPEAERLARAFLYTP